MIGARGVASFVIGAIFGIGLAVAQMTDPNKVISFLTIGPGWDGSLLFVMGAAVLVTAAGFRFVLRRPPLFATEHALPTNTIIDRRLLGGAAIFGVGWGLAGFCPGPAIAGLLSGSVEPVIFMVAMLAGSALAGQS